MTLHHQVTGPFAVHRFAFVQATDPALDPDNHVAAGKPWIDTASGNALKIRNDGNSAWITVLTGSSQVSANFRLVAVLVWSVFEYPDALNTAPYLSPFALVNTL